MDFKNNNYYFHKNGFTLIELSIVLIIISLLIAGIVGGASLIQSAKIRSFNNEIQDYKRQFYAFRVIKDRWPGDYDNTGWLGWCNGAECPGVIQQNKGVSKASYSGFGGEYSGIEVAYKAQPWVELYLEGVGNFKPVVGDNLSSTNNNYGNVNYPCLKSIEDFCIDMINTIYKSYVDESQKPNHYMTHNIKNNVMYLFSYTNTGKGTYSRDPKLLKMIDEKFDDGNHNDGTMRAFCQGTADTGDNSATYDTAIAENKKCSQWLYKLFENGN